MWSTSLAVGVTDTDGYNNNLSNSDFLRRYARRLLRQARADEPLKTLPVLRRIIATQVMPELRVTDLYAVCLLYTSPSPRDRQKSRMPSSA